jgi:hypothetical protein
VFNFVYPLKGAHTSTEQPLPILCLALSTLLQYILDNFIPLPSPNGIHTAMSSFMANLFTSSQAGKHDGILPVPPPPLHTRSSQNDVHTDRPGTPNINSFITPVSTPQGSPSKNRNPPGAIDLPAAFENAMKLTPTTNFGSPTKSGRQQVAVTPLSPGNGNALAVDETHFGQASTMGDESILHKSTVTPGSPLRRQGKENTPPGSRSGLDLGISQNFAALSRQEAYQLRDQSAPTIRKYNTQRGLTAEELEILQKPNVKRLANVTQLCRFCWSSSTCITNDV